MRYLGITEWVGMAESVACLTDVSKVWAACSRSAVEDEGGRVGMVKNGSEEWPICMLTAIERFWFGGKWLEENFEHYRVMVGRECWDCLGFGYWASF